MGDQRYDVVIIGAGIAGLVCGNYLAKAGLKTLLLEHHDRPGGCCSSFRRNGFVFDSGAHSLGSCRPGGQFDRVFQELDLRDHITIHRAEPSDTVIAGDLRVDFGGDTSHMANELAQHFPSERDQIHALFRELDAFDVSVASSFVSYYLKYKTATFRDMLDSYLRDETAKAILCAFLGNVGLASTQVGALPAIAMFKEFVLDGGYYVKGGMQVFVDFLAENFKRLGGELRLDTPATKIIVRNSRVEGVEVGPENVVSSRCAVSTTGPKQTFLRLIGRDVLPGKFTEQVTTLLPSASSLVVYLGVKGSPVNTQGWGRTVWYAPSQNPDAIYSRVFNGGLDENAEMLLLAFPSDVDSSLAPEGHESVYLFTLASFQNAQFWKEHKAEYYDRIVARAEELIPGLRQRIIVNETATPTALYRYTLNDDGATYGLASTPGQFRTNVMPQETLIDGLLLASHWTTVGAGQGGTPMAAYAGRKAAYLILGKDERRPVKTSMAQLIN